MIYTDEKICKNCQHRFKAGPDRIECHGRPNSKTPLFVQPNNKCCCGQFVKRKPSLWEKLWDWYGRIINKILDMYG